MARLKGDGFLAHVEQLIAPRLRLRSCDPRQSRSPQGNARATRHPRRRRAGVPLGSYMFLPTLCSERQPREPSATYKRTGALLGLSSRRLQRRRLNDAYAWLDVNRHSGSLLHDAIPALDLKVVRLTSLS